MSTNRFFTAKEVATILQISPVSAYRLIKKLNEELKNQGKITISGRISKRYFEEKIYL